MDSNIFAHCFGRIFASHVPLGITSGWQGGGAKGRGRFCRWGLSDCGVLPCSAGRMFRWGTAADLWARPSSPACGTWCSRARSNDIIGGFSWRRNLVSRDGFGSPVPRQPAHLHTQVECGAYLRDFSRLRRRRPFINSNHHTPSGQFRVYRVTHLSTDCVHCRESAGTWPVNPKVVPVTCCLCTTMDQLIFASLYYTHYWYEVGMLKVSAVERG